MCWITQKKHGETKELHVCLLSPGGKTEEKEKEVAFLLHIHKAQRKKSVVDKKRAQNKCFDSSLYFSGPINFSP